MSDLTWQQADKLANEMLRGRYSMEWQIDGMPTQVREVVLERGEDGVMMWCWKVDHREENKPWFHVSIALKSGTVFRSLVDDVSQLFTYRWSLVGTDDSANLTAEELLRVCINRIGGPHFIFIAAYDKTHGERRVGLYFHMSRFEPTQAVMDRDLSRQLCEEFNRMLDNAIFERDSSVGSDAGSVDAGCNVAASDHC